jgi:hypothetical protein
LCISLRKNYDSTNTSPCVERRSTYKYLDFPPISS